jgi:5-formyltetrahydrofolate cyclo-ligase
LGRGTGYYDRFFSKNGNVLKVGGGVDVQLLTIIASTKMELKMDRLVPASKIIK